VNGRPVLAAARDPAPWAVTGAEVAALAGTDPTRGLGVDEAARRLAAGGPNEVAHRTGTPVWRLVAGAS
jgi:hypothetical protein